MLSEGYRRGQDTGQVLRGRQSYPVLEGWITEGRGGLGPTGSCRCLIKVTRELMMIQTEVKVVEDDWNHRYSEDRVEKIVNTHIHRWCGELSEC